MAKQLKREMSNRAWLLRVGVGEDDAQDIEAALVKEHLLEDKNKAAEETKEKEVTLKMPQKEDEEQEEEKMRKE